MLMVRAVLCRSFNPAAQWSHINRIRGQKLFSTRMPAQPVLISGAGPSGLVLALALCKNGVDVRIIDKEAGPRLGERGPGVSPRSLELHKILGTFDDIIKAGGALLTSKDYDPADPYKVMKTYNLMLALEPTPAVPFCNPIILGQNHHERILREHLEKVGTKVEFGSELRSFEQSADGVRVEIVRRVDGEEVVEKSETSWLIGADGARSTVRKTLGLAFLGETRDDHEMVIGDIRVKSEPREFWERWGDPKSKIFISRPSSQDPDIISFLIAGRFDTDKLISTPSAVIDEFYEITQRKDIVLGEVIWASKYRLQLIEVCDRRPNIRMVDQLSVGRVFLVGDAAHCHSPTGGQGLNSSIQDSFNLAWKLALVHKGIANKELLRTYDEERLPVIAQMLNKTTELLKHTINDLDGTESKSEQKETRKDMNQLGVNYRGSSIVLYGKDIIGYTSSRSIGYSKESETAALPGDRAPQAPGLIRPAGTHGSARLTSLFGLLQPSFHTALIFSDGKAGTSSLESIAEVIRRQPANIVHPVLLVRQGLDRTDTGPTNDLFDKTLIDAEGHAFEGYHIDAEQEVREGPVVVVVRPDGVIGARVRDAEGVSRYFQGILKSPASST